METTTLLRPGGLYAAKPWFLRRLRPLTDALHRRGVTPDTVTAAGLAAAALVGLANAAGALHHPAWWACVPALALARLSAGALDGALARRAGGGSPAGALRNELADRAADVVMLAPLAAVAPTALVATAACAALATSFVGVLAQALTGVRDSGGPMGKADRVAALALAAAVAAVAGPGVFAAALWLIIAGAAVTVGTRVRRLAAAVRVDRPTAGGLPAAALAGISS